MLISDSVDFGNYRPRDILYCPFSNRAAEDNRICFDYSKGLPDSDGSGAFLPGSATPQGDGCWRQWGQARKGAVARRSHQDRHKRHKMTTEFAQLGLHPQLVQAVEALGFTAPTR